MFFISTVIINAFAILTTDSVKDALQHIAVLLFIVCMSCGYEFYPTFLQRHFINCLEEGEFAWQTIRQFYAPNANGENYSFYVGNISA